MDPVNVASYTLHALFAGLWTGSVLFVTLAVVPLAREGNLNAAPLDTITSKLTTISRVSAVVLFVTGSHMAAVRHTADTLTGNTNGQLVIVMLGLWLVLMATVEIGAKKLTDGTERTKVREPARNARPFFLVASLAGALLLVTAGLISAANLGFFTL